MLPVAVLCHPCCSSLSCLFSLADSLCQHFPLSTLILWETLNLDLVMARYGTYSYTIALCLTSDRKWSSHRTYDKKRCPDCEKRVANLDRHRQTVHHMSIKIKYPGPIPIKVTVYRLDGKFKCPGCRYSSNDSSNFQVCIYLHAIHLNLNPTRFMEEDAGTLPLWRKQKIPTVTLMLMKMRRPTRRLMKMRI